ncbi:MAG: hypothetical protein R3C97_01435 [Geminicoccaceae bacterium]
MNAQLSEHPFGQNRVDAARLDSLLRGSAIGHKIKLEDGARRVKGVGRWLRT